LQSANFAEFLEDVQRVDFTQWVDDEHLDLPPFTIGATDHQFDQPKGPELQEINKSQAAPGIGRAAPEDRTRALVLTKL
jgi:hypothetical protein